MSTILIYPRNAPTEVTCNGGTVTNIGAATVYYADSQDVTPTSFEGSIDPGVTATLEGLQFFVATARTAISVIVPVQTVEGTSAFPLVFSRETAVIGASGDVPMSGSGRIDQAALTVTAAPAGSVLTIQLRKNASVIASLTIPAGSTASIEQTVGVEFGPEDVLDVNCTSAGTSTAATGVIFTAWIVLSSLTTPTPVTDTDGGAYMDLVMQETSLVSYWGLANAGSVATDHMAVNDGIYQNSPTRPVTALVTGGDGSCRFNGTSQYVVVPGTSSLQPASISVEAWIKLDTVTTGAMIIDIGQTCFELFVSDPVVTTTHKLQAVFFGGSFNLSAWGTTELLPATRYHVAASWNNATKLLKVFVNGVQEASQDHTGYAISWGGTTTGIGGGSAGISNFLDGDLDEIAVYNTAVPAATFLAHYQAGL